MEEPLLAAAESGLAGADGRERVVMVVGDGAAAAPCHEQGTGEGVVLRGGSAALERKSSYTSAEEAVSAFSHKNAVLHQLCKPAHVNGEPGPTFSRDGSGAFPSPIMSPHPYGDCPDVAQRLSEASAIVKVCAEGPPKERSAAASALHGALFGTINFIVCVPTLVSYAAIVFRLKVFAPDLPALTKLFFLSSSVHQLVFTVCSSLPFAVGQVQDVGLIFLSQISTNVYKKATDAGYTYEEALATVLIACALATAVTGIMVWLVGRLRLSGYVQLLPLPVVGGYLGYIGYFCLAAGASLGTGLTIEGFETWLQFFVLDGELWCKLALTISFALVLFYVAYRVDHVAALPVVLVAAPVLFFAALAAAGVPLEDARAHGLVPVPSPDPAAGWACFRLYHHFRNIAWHVLPSQIPTVIGLVCVVCFGSVLDIAAIQTGQTTPLDFDGELRMIGVSNTLSGMCAGFTGSYIFSQTIFSQRQGVVSKMNGYIVFLGEFALFLMPVDVLQFFPGFYIGGIMAFFGFDIMLDWLGHSRQKVSVSEYGLLLATFLFVMFLGVISGCAAGVAASAAIFIVVYGTTPAFDIRIGCASTAMRSFDERAALQKRRAELAVVELRGYLFFGAALQLSDRLLADIRRLRVQWVVLDFTHVAGVDSTSARALSKLMSVLRVEGVRLAIAAAEAKAHVQRLLSENGALPTSEDIQARIADTSDNLDAALAWCERDLLREADVAPPGSPGPGSGGRDEGGGRGRPSWRQRLVALLGEFVAPLPGATPGGCAAGGNVEEALLIAIASRMEERRYRAGERIFAAGDKSDAFMLLIDGEVESHPAPQAGAADGAGAAAEPVPGLGRFTFTSGALLGEVDFYLGQPMSYTAVAGRRGCRLAAITRAASAALEREDPRLALLVQRVALRSVCLLTEATTTLFYK